LERCGDRILRLRQGRDQRESADEARMVEAEREGDPARDVG
jgi:hypothetical protein